MVSYEKKDRYDIDDLIAIMKILRSEEGCPWDRVQTHESIRQDFLEETCEAMEAIDRKDAALLREELGDVLLQVVFHAEIEAEKGVFDFGEVCDGICRKLILRHPHVFSDVHVADISESLANWDKIKKEDHGQVTATDTLKGVAKTFPSLMRAQKVGKRAMRAGFDFENAAQALEKLEEEVAELKEAAALGDADRISEELGDVLFSCANFARKSGTNAELCLERAVDKFINRFEVCENIIREGGTEDMSELSMEELDRAWNEAKRQLEDRR